MDTYRLLRDAVTHRQRVIATYEGHECYLWPQLLGAKDGRPQGIFLQYAGETPDGPVNGPVLVCLPVGALHDVRVEDADGAWQAAALGERDMYGCIDTYEVSALDHLLGSRGIPLAAGEAPHQARPAA